MIRQTLKSLSSIAEIDADMIIDVRAPSEFAHDHVPGAVNLPVLSDAERVEVGTIYSQQSPFLARKVGAAMVAANAARHLRGPLADLLGDWQPLVYCWRGGQRSGSFATILDQVGWRVHLIEGGYRSYRKTVSQMLYDTPLAHRLMIVDGHTGTGKTALLHHLRDQGAQILDLENLAGHRGSLFGAQKDGQPSQKMFETQLASALQVLDPNKLTWIEGESSKIGARVIPPSVWARMSAAPRIEITAPIAARAAFLATAYADLTHDTETFIGLIHRLRHYHAKDTILDWQALATAGDWQSLAKQLMVEHYDPRYAKSQARAVQRPEQIALAALDPQSLSNTAHQLITQFN
jgi:tRNA 2-selenouridine synthase